MAEKVTQSAQVRDGLPDIELVKLSHKTAHSRRSLSSEQEVGCRGAAPVGGAPPLLLGSPAAAQPGRAGVTCLR